MVKMWLRNFAAVSSIRHTQAKRGVFYLFQAPDIGQISDGIFLCNFWISSQIPSSHIPYSDIDMKLGLLSKIVQRNTTKTKNPKQKSDN